MKIIYHLFVSSSLIIFTPAFAQDWKSYPYTPVGSLLSFPEDEGWHEGEPIEWWYTAGHLTGDVTGNEYSFMVSYFYYPLYGYDGFRIFNLSHENTGAFYHDTSPLIYNELGTDSLNIHATIYPDILEYWQNRTDGTGHMIPFEYTLSVSSEEEALNLDFISLKPPLILGDSGLFNQGASSYTYYFSLTKNNVTGTISVNGINEPVTGTSWIDRQFGSFNPLTEENYEWFSIQLSNEMDINLWNIFSRSREVPPTSAYRIMSIYVDEGTQLTTADFEIERLSFHYMSDSSRCYAQEWRLTSPQNDLDLVISTRQQNNEVQLPFRFFEGSTSINGTVNGMPVTGMGFAELLHSYEKPELTLSYPAGMYWNSVRPIVWHLDNPDDGRPLKYNLECSIDQKQTFFSVAPALTDTLFYWNDPAISEGDTCWFRVTAYSIDSTLYQTIVSNSFSIYNPNLTAIHSLDERTLERDFIKLYPNPAEDQLAIDLNEKHPYQQFQIIDIFGKIVMEKDILYHDHLEIDLWNLPCGIYSFRLFSRDKTKASPFIIQR
jgi:predicted secreted hydrolase